MAGGAALLLALFAATRLFFNTLQQDAVFSVVGMPVPYAAIWSAVLFVALAAGIFLFIFGVETGIKGLDAKVHGVIDLLIDTEAELNKVSWPSSNELTGSTTAVLVSIVVLGGYLFCVGLLISYVMRTLGVLPG